MAKSNKPRKNKASLHASSLARVGTTALVAGLGLFRSNAVDATIIYTDIPDAEIYNASYLLDVNNDQVFDFSITHSSPQQTPYNLVAYDLRIDQYNSPYLQSRILADSQGYAASLSAKEMINANQNWQYSGVMGHYEKAFTPVSQVRDLIGPWPGKDNKYLGLEFQARDDQGNFVTHYGWAALSVDVDTLKATLFGYAYEDVPGKGIAAGAVPEPTSLLLLATGAAVLLASRRNRNGD
jgi:hypothetical protein